MTVTHRKRKSNSDCREVGVKYHCDSCRKDVTDIARIKCAICDDFDLCVECFSSGVEVGEHKSDHDYRVMDTLNFGIFTDDWGADEELLMIEGFEKYGMGNWEDVADRIGSKTKEEVEKHYYDVYVNSPAWPLPDMTSKYETKKEVPRKRTRMDTPSDKEKKRPQKVQASHPANHEIAGYMPGRKEFETEYDIEAEDYCKDVFFSEDDTPEEVELKLSVLDIYHSKLTQKAERKKLIFDRKLVDFKKLQQLEKRRTKDEREMYQKMRVFARMQTAEDFELLMGGLINEIRLREKISQYQNYRKHGITTLSGAQVFEKDKAIKFNQKPSAVAVHFPLSGQPSLVSLRRAGSYVSASSTGTDSPRVRKPANPLDISQAESIHLLTEREQQLCSALRILPKSYLAIKETLIRESSKHGGLKRRAARELIKIDVNKTSKIYDFFLEMGWIKKSAK